MKDKIYRKRQCEVCGAFAYEQYIGNREVLDFEKYRRNLNSKDWEYTGFGALVVTEWYFDNKENGQDRIDLEICYSCKNKIFDILHSAIEDIKLEKKPNENS